jgi:hypothetical protein
LSQPDNTDERQSEDGHQNRRALEGFQLHRAELNKKTRATQGCSGRKPTTSRKVTELCAANWSDVNCHAIILENHWTIVSTH